jgi:DNA-binding transcriptional MerR regulator
MNEPYVSIGDVAKHFAVHENTVRNWIRQEMIPKTAYMKASRVYRFKTVGGCRCTGR